jgi:hypothetical protein
LNDNIYRLVCNSENEEYLKLSGAFANLTEENLVIHFNNDTNSTILFDSSIGNEDQIKLNIKNKKNKKMQTWAVVGIILPSVFAIIVTVAIIIMLKKQRVIPPVTNSNNNDTISDFRIK